MSFSDVMLAFAGDQLGKPYKLGARGPAKWDCISLVVGAARFAGLDKTVVPPSWTVRNLTGWAKKNGHFRDASETPEPGWIFLWGPEDGSRPVIGAGHTGFVICAGCPGHPNGWAISAYNPERGVIEHRLFPKKGSGRGLHGYVVPDYPTEEAPDEEEPETPPPPDAVDPSPTAEHLQSRIDLAIEVLNGKAE